MTLRESLKKNVPAIVTSLIVLIVICNYLFILIPANEKKIDADNVQALDEFSNQVTGTIKDYSEDINSDKLTEKINSRKTDSQNDLKNRVIKMNYTVDEVIKNVIIRKTSLTGLEIKPSGKLIIKRRIELHQDKIPLNIEGTKDTLRLIDVTDYDVEIEPETRRNLTGRLHILSGFKYSYVKIGAKVLFNNGLEQFEEAALDTTKKTRRGVHFKDSYKRIYIKKILLPGIADPVMVAVGIDEEEFTTEAKAFHINKTLLGVCLILLVFLLIPIIKPLISSKYERFKQADLVRATTAISVLSFLLVITCLTFYSDHIIRKNSGKQLNDLAVRINRTASSEWLRYNKYRPLYLNGDKNEIINDTIRKNTPAFSFLDIRELIGRTPQSYMPQLAKEFTPTKYKIQLDSFTLPLSRFDVGYSGAKIIQSGDSVWFTGFPGEIEKIQQYVYKYREKNKSITILKIEKKPGTLQSEELPGLQNFLVLNKDGDMIQDFRPDRLYIRRNLSERAYFKYLHADNDSLPDSLLTAVYSRFSNRYVWVDLVKEEVNNKITAIAYSPGFPRQIQLPFNVGFLLTDEHGKVLLHSDSAKNLNENFYLKSRKDDELTRIYRGLEPSEYAQIKYNNSPVQIAVARLSVASESPLFLFTFKYRETDDMLKFFSSFNALIICFLFGFLSLLLCYLYSAVFYRNKAAIVSHFHFSWLFPHKNKKTIYKHLFIFHCSLIIFYFLLYYFGFKYILYLSLLTGLNLLFFSFIALSISLPVKKLIGLIAACFICAIILPVFLLFLGYLPFGLCISFLLQFYILWHYGKIQPDIAFDVVKEKDVLGLRAKFSLFYTSTVFFNYLLLPAIVYGCLVSFQLNEILNYTYADKLPPTEFYSIFIPPHSEQDGSLFNYQNTHVEGITSSTGFVKDPLLKVLNKLSFHNGSNKIFSGSVLMFWQMDVSIVYLFLSIIALGLILYWLVNMLVTNYFHFDLMNIGLTSSHLSDTHDKLPMNNVNSPFTADKLKAFRLVLKARPDKPLLFTEWISSAPEVMSNQSKMKVIIENDKRENAASYNGIWKLLTEKQKMVLYDFATDYFMNYRNKNTLLELMKHGLVVSDKQTGRLKVMNEGFREYLISNGIKDKVFQKEFIKKSTEGNFSKWQAPLIIVGLSLFVLIAFLNKEGLDKAMTVGGTVIAAVGLLARFLEMAKK